MQATRTIIGRMCRVNSGRGIVKRILLSALAVAAAAAALLGSVDEPGHHYAEEAFKRALVTFAVARTLNGVISVVQGTEVAFEPAGVGVNLTLGQVLDPINDLVEQFSSVMLVATSSLGLQNVLLRMSGWWGVSATVVAVAALVLPVLWWPSERTLRLRQILIRVLFVAIFLRFAVPLLIIGTSMVFDTFLAAEQVAATRALETTSTAIEEVRREATASVPADPSITDRLKGWLDTVNVKERIDRLQERVSKSTEHIINLIVIFVLQTIILPLVFAWLFLELLKSLASRATRF